MKWEIDSVVVYSKDFKVIDGYDKLYDFFNVTEDNEDEYIMYPSQGTLINVFIDDENKILKYCSFTDFLAYYSSKSLYNYPGNIIKIMETSEGLKYDEIVHDNLYYDEIKKITTFHSYTNKEQIVNISPFVFDYLLDGNLRYYIQELLSLILLFDKVEFNYEGMIYAQIQAINSEPLEIAIDWRQLESFGESTVFFDTLKWILSDNIGSINVNLKSTIAKKCLVELISSIDITQLSNKNYSDNILKNLNQSLKLVISDKTEHHFRIKEITREEQANLFKKHDEITHRVNSNFLSLLLLIYSAVIVDALNKNASASILDVLSSEERMQNIVLLLIVGYTFIFFAFITNFSNYYKYLTTLQEMYEDEYIYLDSTEVEKFEFIWFFFGVLAVIIIILFCIYFSPLVNHINRIIGMEYSLFYTSIIYATSNNFHPIRRFFKDLIDMHIHKNKSI